MGAEIGEVAEAGGVLPPLVLEDGAHLGEVPEGSGKEEVARKFTLGSSCMDAFAGLAAGDEGFWKRLLEAPPASPPSSGIASTKERRLRDKFDWSKRLDRLLLLQEDCRPRNGDAEPVLSLRGDMLSGVRSGDAIEDIVSRECEVSLGV
mmetsp:Transcript_68685/g.150106  ORF Transcript_68685/g.150106 Transcript_68685/m.150106 type:complete len:149 (+) Transcript_68685:848-1294(+)